GRRPGGQVLGVRRAALPATDLGPQQQGLPGGDRVVGQVAEELGGGPVVPGRRRRAGRRQAGPGGAGRVRLEGGRRVGRPHARRTIPYPPHAAADRGSSSTRRAAPNTSISTSRSVNADGSGRGISGTGASRVSQRVTPTTPATTTPAAVRTSHAFRPLGSLI